MRFWSGSLQYNCRQKHSDQRYYIAPTYTLYKLLPQSEMATLMASRAGFAACRSSGEELKTIQTLMRQIAGVSDINFTAWP